MSPLSSQEPPQQRAAARRTSSKKKLLLSQGMMTVKIATDETMKVERMIPHFKDMAVDERKQVWYSKKELQRTLNECKETVGRMEDGILLADDDKEITTRGLEYMTAMGFDTTASRWGAVKIVLEEQTRQREAGEPYDAELFSAAVSGISRHRGRIAHLAGMKDARGVYGDGNFKTSVQSSDAKKREPRRGRLQTSNSGSALMDQTRRRRGSRGPLKEKEPRHRNRSLPHPNPQLAEEARMQHSRASEQSRVSDPSHTAASIATTATREKLEKRTSK
jgi:hypothetical protein